ncbi:MAG: protein kinase domain-containing protein [Vicinamibacterales bacterium]
MSLSAGTRLGPYEIAAQIGEGGMGVVYRATDTNLGRQVALKVLPEAFAQDAERLARFEREARTLAALNHPNIAQIYGLEKSAGTTALVMELVEGPTLAERIQQVTSHKAQGTGHKAQGTSPTYVGRVPRREDEHARRGPAGTVAGPAVSRGGPAGIPLDEALAIARQIAEALEAAHEQGIIHRDLKPANVKVRDDSVVKVLDFGLAKLIDQGSGIRDQGLGGAAADDVATYSPTLSLAATRAGVILGTAAYMAPEQARGRPVDKRADIWAFGCVLYETLTGRRAFDGEDLTDTLAAVVRSEPKWDDLPDALSPSVGVFLRRCLHKDPKQRIGDIRDVRLALEGAFETAAPQVAQSATAAQPVWRRALPVAATALVTLVVAGLAVWSFWPPVESQVVTRFGYELPLDQAFAPSGSPVIAVSPDGRRIVYNTRGGLYLRSMGAIDARLIPGTEDGVTDPFFAPDGESIAFYQNGQMKRLSLSGGAAVVICAAEPPFGASWGTDNSILFGQAKGIMRVSANGGTPGLVIPAREGEQAEGLQLLPDGDSVLFSVTTASGTARWDAAHIVVQSLSTGERTVVLQGGNSARYVPTGHLLYALGDGLFAVAFDADRREVTGGPVSVVEGVARGGNAAVGSSTAQYAVSDAGTLVYAPPDPAFGFGAAAGPPTTLVWVDRDGREEPLAAPPRAYAYARLSPDGTRVALDVRDQERDIWIWDLRRQTMTRFTFDPESDILPVWTPDGRRLVWASQRAGRYNLYWQAADGTGAVERLTESPSPQRANGFTPDGRRLVFAQDAERQQGRDLFLLPFEGERRATRLVQTMFDERNAEISPDGRWLAYESSESGQFQIYVRPFPDAEQGRWQVSTSGGVQPLWARSGQELFYLAPDGTLMGVPVDAQGGASFAAGTPATLIAGAGYSAGIAAQFSRTYDVAPDGNRFLRIKSSTSAADDARPDLVVVQGWFEELRQRVPTGR